MDFAENYLCRYQNAPQQANYGYIQITIFTSSLWFNENQLSRVFVTDDLKHVKEPVAIFLNHNLNKLPPNITKVRIFTDNATSQFKNRYILAKNFNMKIKWNFLAAQHGKGACDGIGATIKQYVWRRVKAENIEATNARQFCKIAENSSIDIVEIEPEFIKE